MDAVEGWLEPRGDQLPPILTQGVGNGRTSRWRRSPGASRGRRLGPQIAKGAGEALRDSGLDLLHPIKDALRDRCSMGEVCGAMRDVFGEYQPTF